MRIAIILALAIAAGCDISTTMPRLTALVQRKADTLSLTVTNDVDHPTVPIVIELSIQTENAGTWTEPRLLIHPAAFVLNRRETHSITADLPAGAGAIRAHLVIKEGERGILIKDESLTLPR